MANFLSTKIALRTDTIQNWNSLSNQVLLNGEVAIVMTDEKLPLLRLETVSISSMNFHILTAK